MSATRKRKDLEEIQEEIVNTPKRYQHHSSSSLSQGGRANQTNDHIVDAASSSTSSSLRLSSSSSSSFSSSSSSSFSLSSISRASQELMETFSFPEELQDLILDYVLDDRNTPWKISDYSVSISQQACTLFGSLNRLYAVNLHQHIVRGELAQAKAILQKNPMLLLQRGRVRDYSGQEIEGTAYQMAITEDDFSIRMQKDDGMVEMIESCFKILWNGESERIKQLKEQFSDGYAEQQKKKHKEDLNALSKIVKSIQDAKEVDDLSKLEEECKRALNEFRKYFICKDVIKTGKNSTVRLLIQALKSYVEDFENFGNSWESPKNTLFWRKVIGYIERFLPACYVQAFCHGLFDVVENLSPLKRNLKVSGSSVAFLPLDSDLHARLGYDYAFGVGGGFAGRRDLVAATIMHLETYLEQKQKRYEAVLSVPNIDYNNDYNKLKLIK